jgi:hypothetical protein
MDHHKGTLQIIQEKCAPRKITSLSFYSITVFRSQIDVITVMT